MTLNRRKFIASSAVLAAAIALPTVSLAADPIKLGSMLDTSGIFDAYGKPIDMPMRLTVGQNNESSKQNCKMIKVVG